MSGGLLIAVWVAALLASYRTWRLVGRDDITQPIRDVVFRETSGTLRQYLAKLITCEWCAGTWITLATFAATHAFVVDLVTGVVKNRVGLVVVVAVAAAAVVGFLGAIDEKLT